MSYLGTNKIGKMYLGSTAISKAYLGSNLVFQQGGSQPVMIPYIRGGADGSYIDTGITPDSTTKIIIWARNLNPSSTWVFGSRVTTTTSAFGLWVGNNQYSGSIQYRFGSNGPVVNDLFPYLSHYSKYELSNEGLKINDVLIDSLSSPGTFNSSYNLVLFGINTAGTIATSQLPIDICACKIYKNNILVRDFTAVETPSVGLYDAISNTLFTNAGSGSFTFGTFNTNAYTPLEYVTCTGAQYFDSGIKGAYSLPIVSYFRPDTSTDVMWIIGGRTGSASKRCDFQLNPDGKTYAFGYQSKVFTVYNTTSQIGSDLVWIKSNNTSSLYKNHELLGTVTGTSGSSFSTDYNIGIGTLIQGSSLLSTVAFKGRIGYIGLGAFRSYVPALMSGEVGLYDTYNDTFNPSASSTPFFAGPTI